MKDKVLVVGSVSAGTIAALRAINTLGMHAEVVTVDEIKERGMSINNISEPTMLIKNPYQDLPEVKLADYGGFNTGKQNRNVRRANKPKNKKRRFK